jgi:hypothetical protein
VILASYWYNPSSRTPQMPEFAFLPELPIPAGALIFLLNS